MIGHIVTLSVQRRWLVLLLLGTAALSQGDIVHHAIEQADLLETKAKEVGTKALQAEMDAGYGIYAGGEQRWAVLVFNARAAQWASREEWHPQQQGRWCDDGRYELTTLSRTGPE